MQPRAILLHGHAHNENYMQDMYAIATNVMLHLIQTTTDSDECNEALEIAQCETNEATDNEEEGEEGGDEVSGKELTGAFSYTSKTMQREAMAKNQRVAAAAAMQVESM